MAWGGWIYFIGAIASTIMAYNWASWVGDEAFIFVTRMMMGETASTMIQYLESDYVPSIAKKFYKKFMIVQSIIETGALFAGSLFFLWLFNTILLQFLIIWECQRLNFTTIDIAARNALAGAISASIVLLVWNILTIIPLPFTKILLAIEGFPFFGWMIIPAILLVFNLAFGAIGKAVALSQGCAPVPITPPTATGTPAPPSTTPPDGGGFFSFLGF